MKRTLTAFTALAATVLMSGILALSLLTPPPTSTVPPVAGQIIVHPAVAHDVSPPLASLRGSAAAATAHLDGYPNRADSVSPPGENDGPSRGQGDGNWGRKLGDRRDVFWSYSPAPSFDSWRPQHG